MPRETKTQKLEKKRQQEFEQWNQFWLTYPDRLALLIYGYGQEFAEQDYTVSKFESDEGVWFHLSAGSDIWGLPLNLQAETDRILAGEPINTDLIYQLESAESALWRAQQARDEEQRLKEVRAQALAKLSEEERALLGLE
jgi:hypothetical protein